MATVAAMTDRAAHFRSLHQPGKPLLLANAWDRGSARLLAHIGFEALATTSAGYANSLGRSDSNLTRDETIAHAAELVGATELPVSADLEDGFGASPDDVATTAAAAVAAGLAGFSIEDWDPDARCIHDIGLATERIAAAAEVAHAADSALVLTGRAENHLRGIDDLDDTISRLVAYADAGADVLYAPAVASAADIARIVEAVARPVNVLAIPGVPPIAELAGLGVARVSVGSGFALAAYGGLVRAATELRDDGTYGYWPDLAAHAESRREAFVDDRQA